MTMTKRLEESMLLLEGPSDLSRSDARSDENCCCWRRPHCRYGRGYTATYGEDTRQHGMRTPPKPSAPPRRATAVPALPAHNVSDCHLN